ncbi:MAG: hypothetical protein K0U37_08665 [Gammaproteobacteria bacterium]|nr:hypothetical protein [Gammaproteobacteria bacterium]
MAISTASLTPEARQCVEQALRTAAATVDITKKPEDITKYVGRELERVISSEAGGFIDSLKDKENAAAVITVAFAGIAKLVASIHQGVSTVKEKRGNLRDQLKMNSFVFIVPDDEDSLKDEQRFIKEFIDLIEDSGLDDLQSLLGVRSLPPEKRGDPTTYCVFPFSDMDTGAMDEASNTEALDNTRKEMHAHIRTRLSILRKQTAKRFKEGNWFIHLFKSQVSERDNYLNDYNQELFMLTAISNLLWNLQHPMNATTKRRLSSKDCIALCKKIDKFLTTILAANSAPRLKENAKTPWADYVSTTRILVRDLQRAYEIEKLKEFPISSLSVHARETVKMTTRALFELLYQDQDGASDKQRDDPKTADRLVEILRNLRRYLSENYNILTPFRAFVAHLPDDEGLKAILNPRPETLIDILIIFSHLPRVERLRLRAELKAQEDGGEENSGRFLRELESFDDGYIRTLNHVLKKKDQAGLRTREARAHLIGRRLTPCLALLADAFKVDVDTTESYQLALDSQESSEGSDSSKGTSISVQNTGEYQVAMINRDNRAYVQKEAEINAVQGQDVSVSHDKPYFYWSVSPLLDARKSFGHKINKLPPSGDKMAGIAELIEEVAGLINTYRHVLQNEDFKIFLTTLIADVREVQLEFKKMFQNADKAISRDESVDDQLRCNLVEIIDKLGESLEAFETAAIGVANVIADPDFARKKREEFMAKLDFIDEKYFTVFGRISDIKTIFFKNRGCTYARLTGALLSSDSPRRSPLPRFDSAKHKASPSEGSLFNEPRQGLSLNNISVGSLDKQQELQALSLISLIDVCYESIPYLRKSGAKGTFLKTLKKTIETRSEQRYWFTVAELKMHITDIVTMIIQDRKKKFGGVKSENDKHTLTQALIRAVKDKKVNLVLPIAEIFFENKPLLKLTNADMINGFASPPKAISSAPSSSRKYFRTISRRFSSLPFDFQLDSFSLGVMTKEKELEAFSLIGLIDVCHDSMSYWSQWGHKGKLLQSLKRRVEKRIEQNDPLTPVDLKRYVLDLVRVASSYRQTWFGFLQAEYTGAKSTKALIKAVRDKKVNLVLPLADIIFGDRDLDLSKLSDANIAKRFSTLRASEDWEFAEDEILQQNFMCSQF